MKISEISRLTNTPTSTIRAYEKWGLITPPKRQSNGYRVYETYHVTQVQIVRLLFGGFLNRRLRKITYQIDNAMKIRDQKMCMECTLRYQEALLEEKGIALSAIEMIRSAAENRQIEAHDQSENKRISAAEAANLIHTTKDSIRNWERNGLINIGVQPYERRTYGINDVERMKLIKTMLAIGFSMSTIKRFFVLYDEGKVQEAIKSIQTTPNAEDILTTADAWIHMLTLKEEHTKQILSMIKNI